MTKKTQQQTHINKLNMSDESTDDGTPISFDLSHLQMGRTTNDPPPPLPTPTITTLVNNSPTTTTVTQDKSSDTITPTTTTEKEQYQDEDTPLDLFLKRTLITKKQINQKKGERCKILFDFVLGGPSPLILSFFHASLADDQNLQDLQTTLMKSDHTA